MITIRIIVAGSRDFNDVEYMRQKLNALIFAYKSKYSNSMIEIVSGGANGADWLGEKYAEYYDYALTRMPADRNSFGAYAGHIRNRKMLNYAKGAIPVLAAFWDGKSTGTKNMISISREAKIDVHVFYYKYRE